MIIELEEFLKEDLTDKVFILETDTVYGLGCLMNSESAAKRILEIKERPEEKHFSLLVSNFIQVDELTKNYRDSIEYLNEYWPGAVTFIFMKSDKVPHFISADDTVGLRMPDNDKTLKAIEHFGPMIMTSLNKSGETAITSFDDCVKYIDKVDYIVRGENLTNIPSTVYDIKNKKVLRKGSVKINY